MNTWKKSFYTSIFLSLLLFSACSSSKEIATTLPNKIAPNNCRISGTIVSIDKITESSGPCSIHPCVATVKVNFVIGTGFGLKVPLVKNDTIKIKFEFTLSETSTELFPTLNYILPGLSVGNKFIGDVEKVGSILLSNNSKPKFQHRIFNYKKIY